MQKSVFACEIWFYIHHGVILSLASQYVLDMDQVIENNFFNRTVNCLVHMKNAIKVGGCLYLSVR